MTDCELVPTQAAGVAKSFNPFSFLDESLLEDVTVVVNGESFVTNRFILSANSYYFRELLSQTPKVGTVNITDMDANDFASVLSFFGNGEWKDPSSSRLDSMLSTLKTLNLVNYKKVTTDFIISCLSVENFHKVWSTLKDMDLKETEREIAQYIARNIEVCCKSKDFSLLSLQQLISVLTSPYLKKVPSLTILQCMVEWCEAIPDKRSKYLPSLATIMGMQFPEETLSSSCYTRTYLPPAISEVVESADSKSEIDLKSTSSLQQGSDLGSKVSLDIFDDYLFDEVSLDDFGGHLIREADCRVHGSLSQQPCSAAKGEFNHPSEPCTLADVPSKGSTTAQVGDSGDCAPPCLVSLHVSLREDEKENWDKQPIVSGDYDRINVLD